jgi:hypothetical protein
MGWWLGLHQPPWSFGFDSQTRGTRENRAPPCVKVPGSSRVPVCGGQPSPHKPRLVVSHSTCPPLSSSPHAHSFVLGTAVINNRPRLVVSRSTCPPLSPSPHANSFIIGTAVINTLVHVCTWTGPGPSAFVCLASVKPFTGTCVLVQKGSCVPKRSLRVWCLIWRQRPPTRDCTRARAYTGGWRKGH